MPEEVVYCRERHATAERPVDLTVILLEADGPHMGHLKLIRRAAEILRNQRARAMTSSVSPLSSRKGCKASTDSCSVPVSTKTRGLSGNGDLSSL